MIFRLIENIRISVTTSVGSTDFEDTGMGVGQGTSDGTIISAVGLDNGVTDAFSDVTLVSEEGETEPPS